MSVNGRSFAMDQVDVTAARDSRSGRSRGRHARRTATSWCDRDLSKNGRSPAHQAGWRMFCSSERRASRPLDNPAAKMPLYHCHILEHEDHGMMGQFAVV
jgi:FtsP/CotA-like multicopper oxidase with cupredoxin domain